MKIKILGLILFGLIFVQFVWSQYSFDLSCLSDTHQIVAPNGVANFDFRLTNTGFLNDVYALDCQVIESIPGWFETFCLRGVCLEPGVIRFDTLNAGQFDTTIHITVYTNLTQGREILSLKVSSLSDPTQKDSIRVYTQVGSGITENATLNLKYPIFEIYPNPIRIRQIIHIRFPSFVKAIRIYDITGRSVRSFYPSPSIRFSRDGRFDQSQTTSYCLIWDGQDQNGQLLPIGSYTIGFIHNSKIIISKPIILIR